MKMRGHAALIAALLALGCAKHEEAPADAPAPANTVRMDAPTQARMGVRVAPIAASTAAQAAHGYARVMDVGPLAAIDSEGGAAQAAAAASQSEYRRLAALARQDQAASARAVEAARAQAAADNARAMLATRRVGLEWGPGLERMAYAQRARLLNDIAAARAALLRIDAPDIGGGVTSVVVRAEAGAAAIPVSVIGPAAATDARLQTAGLLAVARGSSVRELPAGRLLPAELELSAPEAGFVLPSSALIRTDNSVWVYVKTGAGAFERRDVARGRALQDGWFVAQGFAAGDQIVVDGATSLLAAERGPTEAE
ncbi:MAG: hypothetical protein JNJ73_09065 [Hyphomonadaceae bacterium]|nr:hypothetical protein [Hyphomonadaceae bacterium]